MADIASVMMSGLTWNSIDLDRRLLSGLEASAFDSAAVDLAGLLTDAVIDSALRAMPLDRMSAQNRARAEAVEGHRYIAGGIDSKPDTNEDQGDKAHNGKRILRGLPAGALVGGRGRDFHNAYCVPRPFQRVKPYEILATGHFMRRS